MNRHQRRKAKKYEAKRQHYISQGYMEAWHDPNKPERQDHYVWLFERVEGDNWSDGRRKSPKNIFHENNMYTIVGRGDQGERDLSLEEMLKKLEQAFCFVRRNILTPKNVIDENAAEVLAAFTAATQWRTPRAREHVINQWEPVLEKMRSMKEAVAKMSPKQMKRLSSSQLPRNEDTPSIDMEQVEDLVDAPLQSTLASHIRILIPLISKMTLTILHTDTRPGFITSDEPCVWFDPEAYKRPPMLRGPALMYPSIEITLPISPNQMLFYSHLDWPQYVDIDKADFGETLVNELNRRTCGYARNAIVVNKREFRLVWTETGEAKVVP